MPNTPVPSQYSPKPYPASHSLPHFLVFDTVKRELRPCTGDPSDLTGLIGYIPIKQLTIDSVKHVKTRDSLTGEFRPYNQAEFDDLISQLSVTVSSYPDAITLIATIAPWWNP